MFSVLLILLLSFNEIEYEQRFVQERRERGRERKRNEKDSSTPQGHKQKQRPFHTTVCGSTLRKESSVKIK